MPPGRPRAAVVVGQEMPPLVGVDLKTRLRRMTQAPIVVLGTAEEVALAKALLSGTDVYLKAPGEPAGAYPASVGCCVATGG